ncbi:hypothetical protein HDV01_005035 [Terramyces sp. JEL0728]|nr:hypothetical protein HDV01_005035 [Terramyces sp. JEL0728]
MDNQEYAEYPEDNYHLPMPSESMASRLYQYALSSTRANPNQQRQIRRTDENITRYRLPSDQRSPLSSSAMAQILRRNRIPVASRTSRQIASMHPSFRTKTVCHIGCGFCQQNICKRGMKAILLADTRTNGTLESGGWSDIRPRTLEHVSFKTKGYSVDNHFPNERRYICALPVIKEQSARILLYNNYLFYCSDSLIYGKSLVENRRVTLTGHSANVVQIKDNGRGVLVSLDNINNLLIWEISGLRDCLPIATCSSTLGFSGKVISFDILNTTFAVLFNNGTIAIWDVFSGAMTSMFSLIQPYVELLKIPSSIVLGEQYLVIGLNNGDNLLFEKHKSVSTSTLKHTYILTRTIKDSEVSDHAQTHSPYTLIVKSNFMLTNGAFPDEITFWNINPPLPVKQCGNLYTGGSLTMAKEFEIPCLVKDISRNYSISELKSMERYSIAVPQLGDIQVAKMDFDDSMIIAYSAPNDNGGGRRRLLVWDFRVGRKCNRHFEYVLLGSVGVWLAFDHV